MKDSLSKHILKLGNIQAFSSIKGSLNLTPIKLFCLLVYDSG